MTQPAPENLTELLEKERLFGVCRDCGHVLDDEQRCGCEPEWDFPTCLCPNLDAEIWNLYSHYYEEPVCENGVVTSQDRRREEDLRRLKMWCEIQAKAGMR